MDRESTIKKPSENGEDEPFNKDPFFVNLLLKSQIKRLEIEIGMLTSERDEAKHQVVRLEQKLEEKKEKIQQQANMIEKLVQNAGILDPSEAKGSKSNFKKKYLLLKIERDKLIQRVSELLKNSNNA